MIEFFSKKLRNEKGFTLVELIVVIGIIGILASISIPRLSGFQDRARRVRVVTDAKQLATAIDLLIAESANAQLLDTTGLQVTATEDDTIIEDNEAIVMAGIIATNVQCLTIEADGGFTLIEDINNIRYTATRGASGDAPTITQADIPTT